MTAKTQKQGPKKPPSNPQPKPKKPTELESLRQAMNQVANIGIRFVSDRHAKGGEISNIERDAVIGSIHSVVNTHNAKFPPPQDQTPPQQ